MKWFYNWIAQGLIAEYGQHPTTDPFRYGDLFFRVVWRKREIAKFVIHHGRGKWEVNNDPTPLPAKTKEE